MDDGVVRGGNCRNHAEREKQPPEWNTGGGGSRTEGLKSSTKGTEENERKGRSLGDVEERETCYVEGTGVTDP